jgi:hypothetical protein
MLPWAMAAQGEDAYYQVRFVDMNFTEGALPKERTPGFSRSWLAGQAMEPYAVLDAEGDVFIGGATFEPWMQGNYQDEILAVRAPKDKDVTGRLFLPKPDLSGMVPLAFKISSTAKAATSAEFLQTKEEHYRRLRSRNIPGGAWFRFQEEEAAKARTGKTAAPGPNRFNPNRPRPSDVEDTYELFSGGRAVSENLQLDRALLETKPDAATVELTNIPGITVKEMDWKPLIKDLKPEIDPLAAFIPADQHALFFPSFQALTEMMDEADTNGTPVLQMFEPRSEDMDSRGRYQKQLCLGMSEIARRLGPQVIGSVAFTGSDPYLRTGTDLGVLFEAKQPEVVMAFILARQAAAGANGAAKSDRGEIDGVPYMGVVSPDRAICSYVASSGNVVFVSNSLHQLGQLIRTGKGGKPTVASQDEYIYFRSRYPRGEKQETAFLILTDATIRRWCGPQWRIANSRRTKAAGALADLQAMHLDALAKGAVQTGPLKTDQPWPEAGELALTQRGVASSVYGSLEFLTPIAELPMQKVTQAEADAYNRWRNGYQQNWSQYFDPIAARFSARPEQIAMEITVMPLIVRTDYREFVAVSTGAGIAPGAGDPHSGTLAHLALAINAQSEPVAQAGSFVGKMAPTLKANPFGWLGQSISLYADEDPFWEKLAKAEKASDFLGKHYYELPAALNCEVKNPLGLAAFLTALRAYSDQTAPGMTKWENRDYNGQTYVKVSSSTPDEESGKWAAYYVVTPKSLTVTLNESVLKRAVDRQASREAAKAAGKAIPEPPMPWLGTNLCLQIDRRFLTALQGIFNEESGNRLRILSWNNLPILNEWKRRFPAQDPVKLHEQFWQTKLVCPGGGAYVWNEKWQTMESTVFGHPGELKQGPATLGPLSSVSGANLGLSFENQGLSAKAVVNRKIKQP